MRRAHIGLLALALLLAGCGDGEGTGTTISSREAPAPDDAQTDQTPPPETTPGRAPASTVPLATPTTPTGGGGGPYDYGNTGDTTQTTATTAPGEGEDGGEDQSAAAITTANSDLGQILVGPDGMTLYVFLPDEQSESTCYDACAATWPPLEGQLEAGAGVDESLLGTSERTDGTSQATYNGWPLYHYVSDSEPGDVTGQGVGDNWFVVDPAGEVVDG